MPAVKPADCRKLGVSEQTFYRWKAKFGGMDVSDAKRLKQLEDENRRLKQMVADQALDLQALKAVLRRKMVKPAAFRRAVGWVMADYKFSFRRACRALGFARSSWHYRSQATPWTEFVGRLRALAASRPRSGYRMLYRLLRREGFVVNHKRIYRLYRAEALMVRQRHPTLQRRPSFA